MPKVCMRTDQTFRLNQCCASTMYGTVYAYMVRHGYTVYNSIYTIPDHTYGKIRYGVRYGAQGWELFYFAF